MQTSAPPIASPPSSPTDKTIVQLGYAGLLPFVGLAGLMWLVRADRLPLVATALVAYAGVIVSFLGGIHWGLGFMHAGGGHAPTPSVSRRFHFVWGIVPSLLAWLALMLPALVALTSLSLTLLVCYAVDRHTYPALGLSHWLRLRLHLTLVATLSCMLGAAAL